MQIYIEKNNAAALGIKYRALTEKVVKAVLDFEGCPFEAEVNVLLTDDSGIKELNKEFRGIDRPTDVLSFPCVEWNSPSCFSSLKPGDGAIFNLETGELMLGDIVISTEKVISQAQMYGHKVRREYAFLIAHSMLHLLGYDHEAENERLLMEEKQNKVLNALNITR